MALTKAEKDKLKANVAALSKDEQEALKEAFGISDSSDLRATVEALQAEIEVLKKTKETPKGILERLFGS